MILTQINNKKIFISVLLCCYNDEKYISSSIDSVLNQSYKNFEFIIVDDASNEKTKNILAKYKKNNKIKIISNKVNLGLTKSLNIGINNCSSEWIARIDSDDIWYKDKLINQINIYQINKYVLISTAWKKIDKNGDVISTEFTNQNKIKHNILKLKPVISHSTVLFKKTIAIKAGLYRERLLSCQDLDLWKRLVNYGEVAYINEPLSKIRIHNDQITNLKRKDQILFSILINLSNQFYNKYKIDLIDDLDQKSFTNLIKNLKIILNSRKYFISRLNFEKNKTKYIYSRNFFLKKIYLIKLLFSNLYYIFNFIIFKKKFYKFLIKKISQVSKINYETKN